MKVKGSHRNIEVAPSAVEIGRVEMKVRVSDVFNSENDIRKNMSVGMNYEIEEEVAENLGIDIYDVDEVLKNAQIYFNGDLMNKFISVDPMEG